jgi:hypothetical protein
VLVLDMIEILPPLGKYKYDTWRILPMKCYIDNFMCLRSCIRNVNSLYTKVPMEHLTQLTSLIMEIRLSLMRLSGSGMLDLLLVTPTFCKNKILPT